MRAAAVATVLGLMAIPFASPSFVLGASAEPGPAARQRPDVNGGLLEQWHHRLQARTEGNIVLKTEAESALQERRRRDAVSRSENVAGGLVLEGYEHLSLLRYPEAMAAFELATEFDPEMPHAHLGMARAHWATDSPLAAVGSLTRALRAGGANWVLRHVVLYRAGWAVVVGLPLAAMAFCTLLFLKTFPLIRHRLQERLGTRLPPATAAVAATLLLWMPLALPWGVAWTPLLWLVLAAPFLAPGERRVGAALVLLAAVCGLAIGTAVRATANRLDPQMMHVAEAARGAVGPERERSITAFLTAAPEDAHLHLLLAEQLRGRGDHAGAVRSYRRAVKLDPTLHAAHNNTGTLYFSLGEYATAGRWFRQAIDRAPHDLISHYNLYLAQEHLFDFAAAESTLAAAQGIDLEQMTRLLSERDRRQGRLDVLQERVSIAVALEHARATRPEEPATPRTGWPFAFFPGLALLLLFGQKHSSSLPMQCASCGRVACRLCALSLGSERACASCLALAHSSTSLPRRTREQKFREIATRHRWQNIVVWALALLLPGGRQVWRGQATMGAVLLALTATVGGLLLTGSLLPRGIYTPVPWSPTLTLAPVTILAATAWLVGCVWPQGARPAVLPTRGKA